MPAAIPIAGAVAGSVVSGAMNKGGGGETQTASKEPWEPTRQPLIDSVKTGQELERYYQQNPFNPLQQQVYQNLFSDLDQFRGQIAPGMMQFANQMMASNYQRGPRQSQMEMMQSQPMQAQQRPQMMQQGTDGSYAPQGGLMAPQQAQRPQGGLLGAQGAFSAPTQGNYGLLDFAQLNPFTATNGIPKEPVKTPEQISEEERIRREQEARDRAAKAAWEDELRGAGA